MVNKIEGAPQGVEKLIEAREAGKNKDFKHYNSTIDNPLSKIIETLRDKRTELTKSDKQKIRFEAARQIGIYHAAFYQGLYEKEIAECTNPTERKAIQDKYEELLLEPVEQFELGSKKKPLKRTDIIHEIANFENNTQEK